MKPDPESSGFFASLKILLPQRYHLDSGRDVEYYGVIFLACGIFCGVVGLPQTSSHNVSDIWFCQPTDCRH